MSRGSVSLKIEDLVDFVRLRAGSGFLAYEIKPHKNGSSRVFISIDKSILRNMVNALLSELDARFSTISGVDYVDNLGLTYHFALDSAGLVLSFKVKVPNDKPEVDSISDIVPAAQFIEREIHDLFGIGFNGHPNLGKWILGDDWPEGVYPLRKDFKRGAQQIA
jgi:Ni,Fe-hydrogenase III component G